MGKRVTRRRDRGRKVEKVKRLRRGEEIRRIRGGE